jgi:hypothetical protein
MRKSKDEFVDDCIGAAAVGADRALQRLDHDVRGHAGDEVLRVELQQRVSALAALQQRVRGVAGLRAPAQATRSGGQVRQAAGAPSRRSAKPVASWALHLGQWSAHDATWIGQDGASKHPSWTRTDTVLIPLPRNSFRRGAPKLDCQIEHSRATGRPPARKMQGLTRAGGPGRGAGRPAPLHSPSEWGRG